VILPNDTIEHPINKSGNMKNENFAHKLGGNMRIFRNELEVWHCFKEAAKDILKSEDRELFQRRS
jgi:hypothetical protein